MDIVFEGECRVIISVAEACWRKENPSHSWHVLDWLCYRQRLKYPLVLGGGIFNSACTS